MHYVLLLLVVALLRLDAADVIFSRRVYAPTGNTYQQLWSLDSKTRTARPLTSAERRHVQPACSPDGSIVWFLSGAFGDLGDLSSQLWSYRGGKTEKLEAKLDQPYMWILGGTSDRVFLTSEQALYRWDGKFTQLASVSSHRSALAPDRRSIAAQTTEDTVTMISTSGAAGRTIAQCTSPVWFPDGKKLACTHAGTVRVIDLTTGLDRVKLPFEHRTTPPYVHDVSPSGGQLLVGTIGANHSSSSPQSDFWVLNLNDNKWQYVGPGHKAIFSPSGGVIVQAPRDLTRVGAGRNWVAPLLHIDPASKAQTPIGSASTSNLDPARCALSAPRRTESSPALSTSRPSGPSRSAPKRTPQRPSQTAKEPAPGSPR